MTFHNFLIGSALGNSKTGEKRPLNCLSKAQIQNCSCSRRHVTPTPSDLSDVTLVSRTVANIWVMSLSGPPGRGSSSERGAGHGITSELPTRPYQPLPAPYPTLTSSPPPPLNNTRIFASGAQLVTNLVTLRLWTVPRNRQRSGQGE